MPYDRMMTANLQTWSSAKTEYFHLVCQHYNTTYLFTTFNWLHFRRSRYFILANPLFLNFAAFIRPCLHFKTVNTIAVFTV